jgi:hypothetical protein
MAALGESPLAETPKGSSLAKKPKGSSLAKKAKGSSLAKKPKKNSLAKKPKNSSLAKKAKNTLIEGLRNDGASEQQDYLQQQDYCEQLAEQQLATTSFSLDENGRMSPKVLGADDDNRAGAGLAGWFPSSFLEYFGAGFSLSNPTMACTSCRNESLASPQKRPSQLHIHQVVQPLP